MHELIHTWDFDPLPVPVGEAFVFRLEVLRHSRTGLHTGRVYRLERYRLHPCYPLTDGPPAENANDALIFVVDENFEPDRLQAHSADAVLQNFQAMLRDIFALPPEWP